MQRPNLFQRVGQSINTWFFSNLASVLAPERANELSQRKAYYQGIQKRPLKLKPGQNDDNLITNFVGLAVDRANAMLLGGGIEFEFDNKESPEAVYINDTWTANKKEIFLQRLATDGEIYGTEYIEIAPDGIELADKALPRLVILDPALMDIETNPMDIEDVWKYTLELKLDNKVIQKVTRKVTPDDVTTDENGNFISIPADTWMIETFEVTGLSSTPQLVSSVHWPYSFPPIIHGQNMPSIHSVYGDPGADVGVRDVQDKYNFTFSNMLKIIRYHAHPKTWGRGLPTNAGNMEKVSWGSDEIVKIPGDNGQLANLEMSSDLGSSRAISKDLRQTIFDLCRVVDVASLVEKAGDLTNFVMKVIYSDSLAKNSVRRALYGEMLKELNRRLLVIGGFENVPAPKNKWGSDLPADESEDAKLILEDLAAGLLSMETASTQRGYDWAQEKDKIVSEKVAKGNGVTDALSSFLTRGQ